MIFSSCILTRQRMKEWSIWKPRAYIIKKPSNNLSKDKMQHVKNGKDEDRAKRRSTRKRELLPHKFAQNHRSKLCLKNWKLRAQNWSEPNRFEQNQTKPHGSSRGNGKIKQRVYFINSTFIIFTHTHNCYLWQNDSYAACILNAIS